MEYVRLGSTGMKVSRICLGCLSFGHPTDMWPWVLDEEKSRLIIKQALDLGINLFDTSDVYAGKMSEEFLGRALRDFASRDQVVIATKVFNRVGTGPNDGGLSRKHILTAIDTSLKKLGTDYIDLYQIHRWDNQTPIEETLDTLNDLIRAGKVLYIGASSMDAWQFAKGLFTSDIHGWARFVSMQNQYSLLYREEEREMMPLCQDRNIAVIPWSPLGRGLLAHKPSKDQKETSRAQTDKGQERWSTEKDMPIIERVSEVADKRGLPMAQIALAWILSKPFVTAPIIGATKEYHLDDAVASLSVCLSADEISYLEEAYQAHPVMSHSEADRSMVF